MNQCDTSFYVFRKYKMLKKPNVRAQIIFEIDIPLTCRQEAQFYLF